MTRRDFLLLLAGQLLAAVVLFFAGAFYGEMHRYDDCELATLGPELFYACPVHARPAVPATGTKPEPRDV